MRQSGRAGASPAGANPDKTTLARVAELQQSPTIGQVHAFTSPSPPLGGRWRCCGELPVDASKRRLWRIDNGGLGLDWRMEMGTNRAALNGFGPRQLARRRLARGPVLALAVVTAPLVAAG